MIKISEIEVFLSKEKISFLKYGNAESVDKFCSIKNIELNGLYYVVGDPKVNMSNSIILTNQKPEVIADNTYIIVDEPQLIFYKLMNNYYPAKKNGIHPTAIIDENAIISNDVSIGANSVVGNSKIGSGVIIKENVVIHDDVIIGDNTTISASSVIGADGVAWIWDQATKQRIIQPQIGGVKIGKNVYIGSNVTIVRGSVNEDTQIGDGVLLSHGTQIGHGVQVKENVHIANNVAIAGNAILNENVFVGAGAVIVSQISIAKSAVIGAGAVISRSVENEGATMIAMPARAIPSSNSKLNGVPEKLSEKK